MNGFITIAFAFISQAVLAQYAPQAGIAGSTAIPAASSLFTGWATGCSISRGYLDINQPSLGYASSGDSSLGIGPVDNFIVSLGDSGTATMSFAAPIYNGPGADFAVFENGFQNPADPEQAFLELAFVEVSSDGINYFRFPAASATQANTQIAGAGVYMNARKINNLAGKYVSNYGTPFDLAVLAGKPGLDVNHVISIRLVDVVGSIDKGASLDDSGRIINDPYPTPFPTGGFDLDAVGVIHQMATGISTPASKHVVAIYPNPVAGELTIDVGGDQTSAAGMLTDLEGRALETFAIDGKRSLDMGPYRAGMYFIKIRDDRGHVWIEKITRL